MLRPLGVEIVDARVQRLQGGDLALGQLISNHDNEVDVAMVVDEGRRCGVAGERVPRLAGWMGSA